MAAPSHARPSAGRLLAALSVLAVVLAPAALAAEGSGSGVDPEILDAWLDEVRRMSEEPATDQGGVHRVEDPVGDHIYSIPGVAPGNPGSDVDLTAAVALRFAVEPWMTEALFSDAPCGNEGRRVHCPEPDGSGTTPPPPGVGDEILGVAFRTAGTPPWAAASGDRETYYQYALVADTDGAPANDFAANDPYAWDFFQGTDRWFTLDAFVGRDPNLIVTDANWILQPSNARVVVDEDLYVFLIDGRVVTVDGGWRGSAFRSTGGTYEAEDSAGDVTGADPTEPLLGFPDQVTTFTTGAPEEPGDAQPTADTTAGAAPVDMQPTTEAGAAPAPTSTGGDNTRGSAWLVWVGGALIMLGAAVTVRARRERGGPAGGTDAAEQAAAPEPRFAPGVTSEDVRRALDRDLDGGDILPREPTSGLSDADVRDVLDRRPVAPDEAPAGPASAPRSRPTAPPLTSGLDPEGHLRIRRCPTCGGTQIDDRRSRCRSCDGHVPDEPEPVISEEPLGDGGTRITVLDRNGSTTVTDRGPDGTTRLRRRTNPDGTTIEEVPEEDGVRRSTRRPDGSRTVELVDPETREIRLRSDYLPGYPDDDFDQQWEYRPDGSVIDRTRDADGRLRERTTTPGWGSSTRQTGPQPAPDSVVDDVISSREERDRSRRAADSAPPPLHVGAAMGSILDDGREQLLDFAYDLEEVLRGGAPASLLDQENPAHPTQPDWREYWREEVAKIAGRTPSQLTPEDRHILEIDAEWQRRDPDYIERLRDHDSAIDDITPIVVLDGEAAPRTDDDEPTADDSGPVEPAP